MDYPDPGLPDRGDSVSLLPETTLDLKDRALAAAAEGITIVDACLPDMPLIYVNDGFERLTGYAASEVLGSNCRFLQGSDTDPEVAETIREAIRNEEPCLVEILNYRRDGTTFWNRLSITPVRDSAGTVTHFIGVQSDVTDRRRAEEGLAEANRRMRFYLDAAAEIQKGLLPASNPELPDLEAAWTFRPCADLAGDTFNFLTLNDGSVGFYIIDVSGHGVPAALLSVSLSHNLSPVSGRSWLLGREGNDDEKPTPPPEVLSRLNGQFQLQPGRPQFFTMIYAIYESRNNLLRYVTAGHPPIILVSKTGEARTLPTSGMPVGVVERASWYELTTKVDTGDRLYLYTDGVTEASNDSEEELGINRLVDMLASYRDEPLQASVDAVRAQVEAWCGAKPPGDDVTILALEV
jgi:PAS domain S-box-containing protein